MLKRAVRVILWVGFILYCVFLVYFLFLRNRYSSFPANLSLAEYFEMFTNFVPFKTITEFLTRLQEGSINQSIVVYNLLGNLVVFLPMGFFLPALFQKINALWNCLALVFSVVLVTEIIQLLLMIGSFDIDDFILNVIGAMVGFGIWKIKPVQKMLELDKTNP